MKKCSKCGKLTDGMFCPNCGTDLRAARDVVLCPNCGNEVNGNFCSNCGYDIQANNIEHESVGEVKNAEVFVPTDDRIDISTIPEDIVSQSMASDGDKKKAFYKRTWFIIICLIIFFPVGLFFMWKYADWRKMVKVIVTIVIGLLLIISVCLPTNESENYESNDSYINEEYTEADDEEDAVDLFTSESDYSAVDYDSLARTPDDYLLDKVTGTGKVIQVIEGDEETQLRISLDEYYNDVVLVFYDSDITYERVLEDDNVTYYGTSYGLYTYESTMGGEITVPLIQVHKIVRN